MLGKLSLLNKIRVAAEARQNDASPLSEMIERWLACEDSQHAGSALAQALLFQENGEPVLPGPGIWPIPPA
jgi:hypothetical protein